MKTYNCPSCGARIALRDINVKSDVMLCRACGKTVSCSRYLQREEAGKAPGEPPKRVRVIHNDATFDRPREERIEWKYGLWGLLFGVFLMCVGGVVLWHGMVLRTISLCDEPGTRTCRLTFHFPGGPRLYDIHHFRKVFAQHCRWPVYILHWCCQDRSKARIQVAT